MSESIGVLYAPFQFASLCEPHTTTLTGMFSSHQHVVIALPVRRVTPTKNAPLDYATREAMIRQYFGTITRYVHVVPVPDRKYPKDKVAALETAVKSLFSSFSSARLYADHSFVKLYKENGGMWPAKEGIAFEMAEAIARKTIMSAGARSDTAFRQGAIHGMLSQFPISWPTVDMAIRWWSNGKVFYLFGKKPGENGWRFPGGFKDRQDPNFETAVLREAGEEVLKPGVDPNKVFDTPQYICSRNVNDWRYAGESDGITTMFFQVNYNGFGEEIKAGDDLKDAKWFQLSELKPQDIEGEHIYLYQDLCKYEKERTGPQHCNVCNTLLTCDCGIPKDPNATHQVYMEDCWTCNHTGKIPSAFQSGVMSPCDRCCGISKSKGMTA